VLERLFSRMPSQFASIRLAFPSRDFISSMCRCALVSLLVSEAVAQTFPDGIVPLLSKMRADMESASGAQPSGARALASNAAAELADEVARDQEAQSLAKTALAIATRDVQRLKYVGACVRASGGCPVDWQTDGTGSCVPPIDYDGSCGATDVSAFSPAQTEEFSLSCKAAWPCKDCQADYSGCPVGWGSVGRLCVAPNGYDGICSPVIDLSSSSVNGRASWSASCGARWPCKFE
jgi:CPW-WPC domain-containing protein